MSGAELERFIREATAVLTRIEADADPDLAAAAAALLNDLPKLRWMAPVLPLAERCGS